MKWGSGKLILSGNQFLSNFENSSLIFDLSFSRIDDAENIYVNMLSNKFYYGSGGNIIRGFSDIEIGSTGSINLIGDDADNKLTAEGDGFGRAGNNEIDGMGGDDELHGGDGNDRLDGGSGSDQLTGGGGIDTFIAGNGDTVEDLEVGEQVVLADGFSGGMIVISHDGQGGYIVQNLVETDDGFAVTGALHIKGQGIGSFNLSTVDGVTTLTGLQTAALSPEEIAQQAVDNDDNQKILNDFQKLSDDLLEDLAGTGINITAKEGLKAILGILATEAVEHPALLTLPFIVLAPEEGAGATVAAGAFEAVSFSVDLAQVLYNAYKFIEDDANGNYPTSEAMWVALVKVLDPFTEDTGSNYQLVNDASDLLGAVTDKVLHKLGDYISDAESTLHQAITTPDASGQVVGTDNTDTIIGLAANEALVGAGGDDILVATDAHQTMQGGAGNDVYYVADSTDLVSEASGQGIDTVIATESYQLPTNVENLDLYGDGDLDATGNALANVLTGNIGSNVMNGGAGADTMSGGLGDDTYVVDNIHDVVTENANEGTDLVQASVSYTLSANVENLTLTGTAAINGTGNALGNVLTGNSDANILAGLDGNDYIDGGAGADQMKGGAGDDTYVVDNAGDKITEGNNAGNDTVMSSVDFVVAGYIENVILTGSADIKAVGNGEANHLTGNSGNNILNGIQGADTMAGGLGNDTYYVENVGDVVIENANEGTDVVYSAVTYTLPDNVETLILTGYNAVNATGNVLGNTITGNNAANIINGGDGNDILRGLGGNDTLTGGAGADSFVFQAPGGNNGLDHITDFVSGTDKLIFHASDFGFTAGHHLTADEFHVGGRVGTNGQFIYNTATHTLYWDPDGTGPAGAASIAVFDNGVTLHATDFGFV